MKGETKLGTDCIEFCPKCKDWTEHVRTKTGLKCKVCGKETKDEPGTLLRH